MNVNLYCLPVPKMPAAALPPPPLTAVALDVDFDEPPHASSTIAAMPAAPPLRAVRRVNWRRRLRGVSSSLRSSHSSRSIASPIRSDSDIHSLLFPDSGPARTLA